MRRVMLSPARENKRNEGLGKLSNHNIDCDNLNKFSLLDLCCGLKRASLDFKDHGWDVTTVDINPKFNPDIIADVNNLFLDGKYDLIWASPPCTDYSRYALPKSWKCNGGGTYAS